jgi:hypothetical protein
MRSEGERAAQTGGEQIMSQHGNEKVNSPEFEDVDGHFMAIDDEGRIDYAPHPPYAASLADDGDDDVEGHINDLDIERKR